MKRGPGVGHSQNPWGRRLPELDREDLLKACRADLQIVLDLQS
jgi:hypothetical protein